MEKNKPKIVVVGGGAGGMMAAGRAGQVGALVTLIEKNKILGKKILISGKGRCNVTNDCEIEELISNFPGNGKFLYGPLYSFSNNDLINFFTKLGVKLKKERGGRVFPQSDSSKDIVDALIKYLNQARVNIITGTDVKNIIINNDQAQGVFLDNGTTISADRIIIATGGVSFPGTGSTGDGYHWAKKTGHTIIPLRPSLIPLEVDEEWVKELQGLSLKNVSVCIKNQKGKKIAEAFGEMIFTHFGVSGPIILTLSRKAVDYWQKTSELLYLTIDLKPALSFEQLDNRLQRDIEKYSNKQLKNSLGDLLPNKMIQVIINKSQIETNKVMNQITKDERENLLKQLKGFELKLTRPRPISEAIVTAGGVSVKEINPQTMESKLTKGLYFAGEVLDIDGITGGYNLQAAFSTGFVAGDAAARIN
ncbi:MAG: FAD-dependent oxidoreductase [Clostridiaceae bacterium BRH_c20a]|nr:MAG: FAD-dependent oxidoreductase [Clostridiaceae bacterium BRH_c20a]